MGFSNGLTLKKSSFNFSKKKLDSFLHFTSMAASSPALSNTSTDTAATNVSTPPNLSVATNPTLAVAAAAMSPSQPKSFRGLNKPRCIVCGNVARSRCPYNSCKSCCSKAQNSCVIHVLKASAPVPEKITSSSKTTSSSPVEQKANEVPPPMSSHRVASFRQLSSNFSQFNNVQFPQRPKKPLTRKEAAAINEWRFSKLKEYKEGNIETENEAFDRYMQNISLLEEVFSVESTLKENTEEAAQGDNPDLLISGLKVKLRSNHVRTSKFRNRLEGVIKSGLDKLRKRVSDDDSTDLDGQDELMKRSKKRISLTNKRVLILTDLNEKLSKARTEDDLKACLELKSLLDNLHPKTSEKETRDMDTSEKQTAIEVVQSKQLSGSFLPKLFCTKEIDDSTLASVDVHFSTLEQIEDL